MYTYCAPTYNDGVNQYLPLTSKFWNFKVVSALPASGSVRDRRFRKAREISHDQSEWSVTFVRTHRSRRAGIPSYITLLGIDHHSRSAYCDRTASLSSRGNPKLGTISPTSMSIAMHAASAFPPDQCLQNLRSHFVHSLSRQPHDLIGVGARRDKRRREAQDIAMRHRTCDQTAV